MIRNSVSRWVAASWSRGPAARRTPLDFVLSLLEQLFRLGVALRSVLYERGVLPARRVSVPVLSVGGLEVGGVGKTPLVVELARLAAEAGERPAILSRGHGRRGGVPLGPVPVPLPPAAWEAYGDEPVWMAERLNEIAGAIGVVVGPNRVAAAAVATAAGATLLLLDDGFQHRGLARDRDIVCVRAGAPFANGHCLPAGPLREPPRALLRAHVAVATGSVALARAAAPLVCTVHPGAVFLSYDMEGRFREGQGPLPSTGEAVLLVTGIAHPERVRDSLEVMGIPLAGHEVFPDHHAFSTGELRALARAGPPLVTTAKDWVRLRSRIEPDIRIAILEQRLVWNEEQAEAFWFDLFVHLRREADTRKPGEDSPGLG